MTTTPTVSRNARGTLLVVRYPTVTVPVLAVTTLDRPREPVAVGVVTVPRTDRDHRMWALLTACSSGQDTSPCAEDPSAPCCAGPGTVLWMCIDGLAGQTSHAGKFTGWGGDLGEGPVEFVDDAGGVYPVRLSGDETAYAALPDLSGAVVVSQEGSCDGKGASSVTIRVTDEPGDLLLLIGSQRGAAVDDWNVTMDDLTCEARAGDCYEWAHNRPVTFDGPVIETLYQGDDVDSGGWRLHVGVSYSSSGNSVCDDVSDTIWNWWITPSSG